MENNDHLTYLKVQNFKKFENLEVENIGQFNLILGDNNVGKTSFLESLLLTDDLEKSRNYLLQTLTYKKIGKRKFRNSDLKFYVRLLENQKKNIVFHHKFKNRVDQEFQLSVVNRILLNKIIGKGEDQELHSGDEYHSSYFDLIPYIPFFKGHDSDLVSLYSEYIQKDKLRKELLIKILKVIEPAIDNIEISLSTISGEPILVISQSNSNTVLPLAFFGDGVLKLFRYFIQIIVFNNSRLMIDEVDTGIHYSRFSEFWEILLKTASENNVQLFMTTHSKECISYFSEAIEQLEYNDRARAITLIESRQDQMIKAFTYDFEQLEHAVEVGNEIRGGV